LSAGAGPVVVAADFVGSVWPEQHDLLPLPNEPEPEPDTDPHQERSWRTSSVTAARRPRPWASQASNEGAAPARSRHSRTCPAMAAAVTGGPK
jgi:hypothetical protein